MAIHIHNSYLKLPAIFFTRIAPIAVPNPQLVIVNYALGEVLGFDLKALSPEKLAAIFSGNVLLEGAEPIAQAYAGHQFGHFTYLGDGRAHLLGEQRTPEGIDLAIQLKGSGKTPYARGGDGRAALEPMLREYLISEAMHALHIPSTRSLAVVTTGETVYRETPLPGAILTRIASSYIRVGSFEYLAAERDQKGLVELINFVIAKHYPNAKQAENPPLYLLKAVIEKQVDLLVNWMRVGFIHGVMNTDNMAISGETIDYGPCAFMDNYHPETVFSAIDFSGRYRFGNQPLIAQWNLARFAETLLPLLHENIQQAQKLAEEAIYAFADLYQQKWLTMMRAKLGIFREEATDKQLIADLLDWMMKNDADYTNTFRDLGINHKPEGKIYEDHRFQRWYAKWQLRLAQNGCPLQASLQLMHANNPAVIPRNHKVNQTLQAASQGDLQPFKDLLEAVKSPYHERLALKNYQLPPTQEERVCQTFCGT